MRTYKSGLAYSVFIYSQSICTYIFIFFNIIDIALAIGLAFIFHLCRLAKRRYFFLSHSFFSEQSRRFCKIKLSQFTINCDFNYRFFFLNFFNHKKHVQFYFLQVELFIYMSALLFTISFINKVVRLSIRFLLKKIRGLKFAYMIK